MLQTNHSQHKLSRVQRGRYFEDVACKELEANGYRILARNYRCPGAEIDIVAAHQGYLVFIEVRGQGLSKKIDPFETISGRKRQKLILGALHYISKRCGSNEPKVRFDIVAVRGPLGKETVDILRGAFVPGW